MSAQLSAPDRPSATAVLVVEDDPDIRDVLMEALDQAGFTVRSAANGAEALADLRAGHLPGVILLDLMMPVMDGWQFRAEQLKDTRLAGIPTMVISAGGLQAIPPGTSPLRKPFDLDQLVTEIGLHVPPRA